VIPGIQKGDKIRQDITVESISVAGSPYYNSDSFASEVKLVLTLVLKLRIVVSRECSIAVPGRVIEITG